MRKTFVIVGLLALVGVSRVAAHHAFTAEFDANQPVKLTGTVVKVEWVNPHAWIHIDVKGADGKVERWAIEQGSPNALIRQGWARTTIQPGTEIIVQGFRAIDGATRAAGRQVTLADGRRLFSGSPETPGSQPEGGAKPEAGAKPAGAGYKD